MVRKLPGAGSAAIQPVIPSPPPAILGPDGRPIERKLAPLPIAVGRPIKTSAVFSGAATVLASWMSSTKRPETPAPAIGTPEFEALLDRDTRSTLREGNRITLLIGGQASFEKRRELIIGAGDDPLYLQTFVARDDQTGRQIADLL